MPRRQSSSPDGPAPGSRRPQPAHREPPPAHAAGGVQRNGTPDEEPDEALSSDIEADDELLAAIAEAEELPEEVEVRGAPGPGPSPVGDSIAMYLNEIGGDPLLNAAQEVDLARKVRRAIEIEERKKKEGQNPPRYDPTEAEVVRIGDEARKKLVRSNLRLVVSIAKKYVNRGLSLLDLIQEGNIGLMRAVERFDPEKGFRFSTYATWWIRQAILRALAEKARMIRIPEYMVDAITQYQRTAQEISQRTGREPSPDEVAQELSLDPQRVRDLFTAIQQPASLEMPVGQEGESTLGEYIPDERTQTPEEAAVVDVLRAEVEQALDRLDPRERQVLQLRYGLDSTGRPHTLEEVARKFKLTRERIRQIESRALRKLRTPERANKLRDFMQWQ
jgi:RNA polymerase primary sigma factor